MPGPVIYVAFAIGTVAAVVAFKEFIYEPHIAPQVEAWAEARRRVRQRRSQVPVAVPVNRNENEGRRDTGKKRGSVTPPENDPMSVELEDMVARETASWKASSSRDASLRQRKTHNVMEESNVFIPYDPMAPTQVVFDSSDTESTRSFKSARSPVPRSRSISTQTADEIATPSPRTAASHLSRGSSIAQRARSPTMRSSPGPAPALPTPVSNMSPSSSRATSPTNSQMYHSASSASSFTPAVIGPTSRASSRTPSSLDAMSDVARSNPASRVTSPFSDIHAASAARSRSPSQPSFSPAIRAVSPHAHFAESATVLSDTSSPLILSPEIGSDYSLPSDPDELAGMILSPSLRSGMFSPSVDLAREMQEDPFEVGSETESWDSFGRRTPEH
ncbi:hypothetical protein EIP91_006193 [Steccherinum ochraceum]|uniref:Uncharacterized protein n=1 Tax=Steccherinum ochraceum TaxID=92696 RepID=A0A4R0R6D5_9APHY|nr:hypothetical protein EIP91_006193 [Steccherinum ochraceum]